MANLEVPNSNDPQNMAAQVEAIAEAAAQHDAQVAQLLNLVPKAAALGTVASRAVNFTKKNWVDNEYTGTPITAADMNRIEQAIVDLNTTLISMQDSIYHILWEGSFSSGSITVPDLSDYHLVIIEGRNRAMLCVVGSSYVCGVMGMTVNTQGQVRVMGLEFTRSGNRLSYGNGFDVVDCRGNMGDVASVDSRIPVTRIIGLI